MKHTSFPQTGQVPLIDHIRMLAALFILGRLPLTRNDLLSDGVLFGVVRVVAHRPTCASSARDGAICGSADRGRFIGSVRT